MDKNQNKLKNYLNNMKKAEEYLEESEINVSSMKERVHLIWLLKKVQKETVKDIIRKIDYNMNEKFPYNDDVLYDTEEEFLKKIGG